MYIGIYINESHISAAFLNQDEEILPIKTSTLSTGRKLSGIPLKIYIEDDFAYVGKPVEHLITNDYNLKYATQFLDDLQHPEKITYTDPTGVAWNAPALLAIFLKKLKNDVSTHNEVQLQGAMVTTTKRVTPVITDALKLAFRLADIPFCGLIDFGKAAWYGTGMDSNSHNGKTVLVYNLGKKALTTSVVSVDKENCIETQLLQSDKNLGENSLQKDITEFLIQNYFQMTQKKIKKTQKNTIFMEKMASNILSDYFLRSELYIRNVYSVIEPAIELVLTRAQIDSVISRYMQQSFSVLTNHLSGANIVPENIDKVIVTGDSQLLATALAVLQKFFDPQKIDIPHRNASEIVINGITLLANDAIEREISNSLLSTQGDSSEQHGNNGTSSNKIPENQYWNQQLQLIDCIQINRTGSM